MIRAQVKWWPGNVTPGGLHVHHVVFGIVFMLLAGAGGFSRIGDDRPWAEIFAALFGVGAALGLDEFGLLLLGAVPLGVDDQDAADSGGWAVALVVLINGTLVGLTLLKGKLWMGLLGVLVPIFAFVGAIR